MIQMKKGEEAELLAESDGVSFFSNDSPLVDWFTANARYLLLGVAAAFLLLLLFYQLTHESTQKIEKDYFSAAQAFAQLEKNPHAQESLLQLSVLLKQRPELQPAYDGLIAENLIAAGLGEEALPFGHRAIQRTAAENHPFYADYASTTLLIAQKQYGRSLQESKTLHQRMMEATAAADPHKELFGDPLFFVNLLRIVSLEQVLGLATQELATWNEWKKWLEKKPSAEFLEQFKVGEVSLLNYAEARIKQLQNP